MNVEILSEVPQNDGRKSVQARYTTSLNDSVTKNYLISDSLSSLDYAASKESDILNQFKNTEMTQLEDKINSGDVSIESIVENLKYLTINESLYSVVGRGITLTSVYRLINLKEITSYTKLNFTNVELSAATGLNISLVELYYNRVDTALTCVDALNELEGSVFNG